MDDKKKLLLIGLFLFLLAGTIYLLEPTKYFKSEDKIEELSYPYKVQTQYGLLEKDYQPTGEKVTLNYLNKTTLSEIKLNTPKINRVGAGYQKVAEIEFTSYEDFKQYLSNNYFELYNKNDGMKPIQRQLDFKYLTIEQVSVDDYSENCITITNETGTGEKCTQVKSGSHFENKEIWEDINKYVFKSGESVKIGIFTDVQINDNVEWIPTIYGVKIEEWAEWVEGLTTYSNPTLPNTIDTSNGGKQGEIIKSIGGDINLSYIYKTSNSDVTKCYIYNVWGGTQLASGSYVGDKCELNYVLTNNTNYNILSDKNGAVYNYDYSNVASKPVTTGNLVWIIGINYNGDTSTTYSRIIVNMTFWKFMGLNINLTSPANNTNFTTNTNYFVSNVNKTGPISIVNVSLLINGTIDQTNTSGLIGKYNFSKTLSDGSYNWTIIAYGNDSIRYNALNGTLFFVVDTTPPTFKVNSSTQLNYGRVNGTLQLNWTVTDTNLNKCWYDYNGTNHTLASCTSGTPTLDNITLTTRKYVLLYANDTAGNLNSTNHSWSYKIFENERFFNNVTAETAYESYAANLTTGPLFQTAKLYYNGTSFTMTQSGQIYNYSRDLPTNISGIHYPYFNYTYDGSYIISDNFTQIVMPLTTTIRTNACSTGELPYYNITFKDENNDSVLTAKNDLVDFIYYLGSGTSNKSLTGSNTTQNLYYSFCVTPQNKTLSIADLVFKYSATGYPLRTFSSPSFTITNSTTNKTLYLLSTADGIYSSFSVVETSGATIQGATVVVKRDFSGVPTVIGQDLTGSDGIATFWVNPNFEHTITVSKIGYETETVAITPSQSLYTITLGRTTDEDVEYTSPIKGILWFVQPRTGTISPGTYNFNVTVLSTAENLENCKLELTNATNLAVLATGSSAATNTSYCFVNVAYTPVLNQNFFGRLSLDTTNTTGYVVVDADWKWIVIDIEEKGWRTITSFFDDLSDIGEFGEGNEAEFSRMVAFFVVVTILMGVLIYFTGIEFNSPGITIIFLWLITLIASAGGFLTFDSGVENVSPAVEKWGFLLLFTIFTINYLLNIIRRSQE